MRNGAGWSKVAHSLGHGSSIPQRLSAHGVLILPVNHENRIEKVGTSTKLKQEKKIDDSLVLEPYP
jgi:hypothetical protein